MEDLFSPAGTTTTFFDNLAMPTNLTSTVKPHDVIPNTDAPTDANNTPPAPKPKVRLWFGTFDTVASTPIPSLVCHSSRTQQPVCGSREEHALLQHLSSCKPISLLIRIQDSLETHANIEQVASISTMITQLCGVIANYDALEVFTNVVCVQNRAFDSNGLLLDTTLIAKKGGGVVATKADDVETFNIFDDYASLNLDLIAASNQWYCQLPIFNNGHAPSNFDQELLSTKDEVSRFTDPSLLQDVSTTYYKMYHATQRGGPLLLCLLLCSIHQSGQD